MGRGLLSVIVAMMLLTAAAVPARAYDAVVQQIQRHLAELSYDPGPADGVAGSRTTSAIERFRLDRGIPSSATNEELLAKLTALAAEASGPDQETAAELQKLLVELGYVPGTIPGVWDQASQQSLWLYLTLENKRDLLQQQGKTKAEQHRDVLTVMREQKARLDAGSGNEFFTPVSISPYQSSARMDATGRFLVAPNDQGGVLDSTELRVWDVASGEQVRAISVAQLVGGGLSKQNWDITSDGRFLIVANNAIQVVDIATGRAVRTFWTRILPDGNAAQLRRIVARPNSTEIIAAEGNEVVIYDWAAGRFVQSLGKYGNVKFRSGSKIWHYTWEGANSFAVSADGRYLATGGTEFAIRVYDLNTRSLAFKAAGKAGTQYDNLVFSGDGAAVFATGSAFDDKNYNDEVYRLNLGDRKLRAVDFYDADDMAPLASGGIRVSGKRRKGDGWDALDKFEITSSGQVTESADQKSVLVSPDGRFATRNAVQDDAGNNIDGAFAIDDRRLGETDVVRAKKIAPEYLRQVDIDSSEYESARVVRNFDAGTGEVVAATALAPASEKLTSVAGEVHEADGGRSYVLIGGPSVGFLEKTESRSPDLGDVRVFDAGTGERRCASGERAVWWNRDGFDLSDKTPERTEEGSLAWSPALDRAFVWTRDGIAEIDTQCRTTRKIEVSHATKYRWKVSPKVFQINKNAKPEFSEGFKLTGDGRRLLAWRAEQAVQAIDPATGQRVAVYRTDIDIDKPSGISPADLDFLKGRPEHLLVDRVLPIPGTTRFLVFANGGPSAGDMNSVGIIQLFDESEETWQSAYIDPYFREWAVSRGGEYLAILSVTGTVKVVDPATGRLISAPRIDGASEDVAFSEDGTRLFVYGKDGYMRTFDPVSGELLTSTLIFEDGEWLTLTPEGFFVASEHGAEDLQMRVEDLKLAPIGNAYNALYRPDLVQAKLAGDPEGKVHDAAAKLDLGAVVDSGPAPRVAIVSPVAGVEAGADAVEAVAEITDQGGGVGKIEWRVNGITLGVDARGFDRLAVDAAAGQAAAPVKVSRRLSLDPGDNLIEVVAYNAKGLIASDPARVTVRWDDASAAVPPRLYVLAAGVNDYWDSRLKLNYAASDAQAVGEAFRKAGAGLYESVEVVELLDEEVTAERLDAVFAELGGKVRPRDVFVLFMAGHGKTQDGRYYFLPQDFRYVDESSIAAAGIDQDRFQAWLAQIPARKSVLLYDTCDSGTLTGPGVVSRGLEQVAALARMTRAMGRTVLSASTDDAPALEGYKGHGVFTYALLQALHVGDTNADGTIEVTELAGAIDESVPEISYAAFNLRQVPQMSIVGSDFPLTQTIAKLDAPAANDGASAERIPAEPTHVVIVPSQVHEIPSPGSPAIATLAPGTQVRAVSFADGFTLVGRDGKLLGYVEDGKLATLQ